MTKPDKPLTIQREKFAQHLARGLDQSEAYRLAFPISKNWKPESVWSHSSRLASDSKVRARVAVLTAKTVQKMELKTEDIARETARLATVDPGNLWIVEKGKRRLKWLDEMDEDTRRCIRSVEVVDGVPKYTLWDKNAAAERAGKMLGMYEKDNRQRTDPLAEILKELAGNVLGVSKDVPPEREDDA